MTEKTKVRCKECQRLVESAEAIEVDGGFFHPKCYEDRSYKKALYDYICRLFGLISVGPDIFEQRKNFLNQGYTDKGILRALRFFYEIKGNTTTKANGRIGIVPYVYEEAHLYFEAKEQRAREMADQFRKSLENTQEREVIYIQKNGKQIKQKSLSSLEKEPEEEGLNDGTD